MKTPPQAYLTKEALTLILAATLPFLGMPAAWATTDTWTGAIDANWSNPGNWTGGNAPPQAGDSLSFGSGAFTTLNNDFTADTAFTSLTFSGGGPFTLNGNPVLLSGQTNGNTIGMVNNSGGTQTIGMSLSLDWGFYTFSTPAGGTLALNGTLTPNLGGVAYFDPNVTSTSFALDGVTGLLTSLEGAGLMYSGSGSTPTGLATLSGGAVVAYSGYTTVASGAIASGNNIELTASGAAAAYTASGITVNTIRALQVGNSGGTATDTLTTTGTLTFGDKGGVYVLDSGAASKACLNLTGGTLTAGTGPGATLLFAVNGTTSGNQLAVNSTIANNGGGAVSVVTVGRGSLFFAGANTYSGGTYVTQGQLQGNNGGSFGTGPIYVAAGATAFLNGNGTYVNDLYISPGNGTVLETGTAANPGALLLSTSTTSSTFSGKLTLLGAPVALGTAGCRLTGNKDATTTYTFTGQITGPGTLDLNCSPHAENITFNNQTANANDWEGGLIIEEILTTPSSARNVIVRLGADNQIPNGATAGDVTLFSADSSGKNSIVKLDLNGHTNTINGLNASAALFPVQVGNSGTANGLLTVGANNANGAYAGITLDSGAGKTLSLVKIGTGTQAFSSALTHSGSTTVSNGTFALSGAATMTNTPTITVASGATLDASGITGLTVGSGQELTGNGTVIGSTTLTNGTIAPGPTATTVGFLTNSGNMTFNGGGAYVWNFADATGTAGVGFSQLEIIGGGLVVGANSSAPFTIKVIGTPLHWDNTLRQTWPLASSANAIAALPVGGFNVDTSAFGASVGTGAFSVQLSNDAQSLLLVFGPAIISQCPLDQTNNAGTPVQFSVTAAGAALPATYQWFQGANLLSNGGTTASGASVTIVSSGIHSTLTLGGSGVQDADAGGYTVTVTDSTTASQSCSATLSVIDAPTGLNVSQSATQSAFVNSATGGIITLTATVVTGTPPLTYIWSLNGTAIATNTTGILDVNVSPADVGTYTVVVSNPAGSETNNTIFITPVTAVANQLVYEPFNYTVQAQGAAAWTAFGATNIFDQATGVALSWVNSGTLTAPATLAQDMRIEPGFANPTSSPNGDSYPWPGLAGNSPNEVYCNAGSFARLPLATGGSISSGTVYFSAVLHVDQGGSIAAIGTDNLCGFGTGTGTTPNTGIYINTPGDDSYIPGIFKTSGGTGALNPGVNGDWSTKAYHRGQIVFIIARLTINPGAANDTFDLWLAPTNSTFGASEANLPPPDVTGVGSSAADVGNVDFFYLRDNAQPFSRRFADLRMGTTWASVTPPSAPTLSLANVALAPGVTRALFASQNAGNPVTGDYTWQFNGGAPLSDGPTGHGSTISGATTATLTITGATQADAGTYTVTGSNTDPSNDAVIANRGTLTGSASATLTFLPPPLSVFYSAPNLHLAWPTNWTGYTLEQTVALNPSAWTTNSNPPYTVAGTNYTVSVNAAAGTKFFRLIK